MYRMWKFQRTNIKVLVGGGPGERKQRNSKGQEKARQAVTWENRYLRCETSKMFNYSWEQPGDQGGVTDLDLGHSSQLGKDPKDGSGTLKNNPDTRSLSSE